MMKKTLGGRARMPATPCASSAVVAVAPEAPVPSKPVTHGLEGRMYLVREPIMPMLPQVGQEKPIIYQGFKNPIANGVLQGLGGKTLGSRKRFNMGDGFKPKLFEESAPASTESKADIAANELILWRPPPDDEEGRRVVSVDPKLTKVLREHQRIGVQFMFDCLMGLKGFNGCGCILADDMGLGKTLQSVAVIWTLLTQGGPRGKPACRKALVVCPASLVKNWAGEFDKWLEKGTCKYVAIAMSGSAQVSGAFSSFRHSYDAQVLISSYETFRGHADEVANCGIDLVVCDEAHKLKNDEASVTKCIANLAAKRRLLISGTPIQNNLDEFFTLVSVANPGVFGDAATFRRTYGAPILRGREPTATAEERQAGIERLTAVSEVTEQFILRRTNRLNARFLPPKQLFNIFVHPTDFQRRLYQCFLKSNVAQKLLCSEGEMKMSRTVLSTIKKLQSLVNHPFLVRSPTQKLEAGFDDNEAQALFAEIDAQDRMELVNAGGPSVRGNGRSNQRPVHEELSGKMLFLHRLLVAIKAAGTGDRIVIISNWTQTLDLIEKMCDHNQWPVHRLDGTMAISKRMKLVQDFNRPENDKAFAFLLSSKAGGCGLNLIGANRLVMFDPDWNPANDRQAMARIWRDGQKKSCFIYRLFTTGTIDEKVYQRQICKDGLSTMMVTETGDDEKGDMKESLAADLVKDLFTFVENTQCATHDMLECKRCSGSQPLVAPQADEVVEDDLHTWSHHSGTHGAPDEVLIDAGQRMLRQHVGNRGEGRPLRDGSRISFTMGCHIVYTAEMIAKLEEEERAVQRQREERVAAAKEAENAAQQGERMGRGDPGSAATTAPKSDANTIRSTVGGPPAPQFNSSVGQIGVAASKPGGISANGKVHAAVTVPANVTPRGYEPKADPAVAATAARVVAASMTPGAGSAGRPTSVAAPSATTRTSARLAERRVDASGQGVPARDVAPVAVSGATASAAGPAATRTSPRLAAPVAVPHGATGAAGQLNPPRTSPRLRQPGDAVAPNVGANALGREQPAASMSHSARSDAAPRTAAAKAGAVVVDASDANALGVAAPVRKWRRLQQSAVLDVI